MESLRRELRKGRNARTVVLVACLALTLVWIQSLDGGRRAMRARATSGAAPQTAPGAVPPAALAEPSSVAVAGPVPVGWGRDPFGPRFREAGN